MPAPVAIHSWVVCPRLVKMRTRIIRVANEGCYDEPQQEERRTNHEDKDEDDERRTNE